MLLSTLSKGIFSYKIKRKLSNIPLSKKIKKITSNSSLKIAGNLTRTFTRTVPVKILFSRRFLENRTSASGKILPLAPLRHGDS
jgi:hypothetical protein